MAFINDEIPTGAINGVNKVYTLLNAPFDMVSVNMDGANYTSYTISGNILTLSDAPTLSLFVDYSTGSTFIPATSSVTFGDIKTEVWTLLGQKSTSTNFSDARVGKRINTVIRNVCRGRVTSLIDPNRIYRAGKLWFIDGTFPIRVQSGSMLTANYSIGDTNLTCSTVGLLGSGYIQMGGEILAYSGTDANGLTGVSGAQINHLATEAINQLYETPVDFEKPQTVVSIIQGTQAREQQIPIDDDNTKAVYYQIFRTGTLQLLKIVGLKSDSLVNVTYTKKITDMGDNSDVNPLPDDYGLSVIANLVAGEFAYQNGMPNGQQLIMDGYDNLQNMYQFFTNTTNVIKQSIKPKAYRNIPFTNTYYV